MKRLALLAVCLWILLCVPSGADIISSYEQFQKTENHVWALGISELNVTFTGFSDGIRVLREVNSAGTVVATCSISASSGGCTHQASCSCKNITDDTYEATYPLSVDDSKNRTTIILDTGGGSPAVLGEALILLEECPDQKNAHNESSFGGCTYNHFDCATLFSCNDGFRGEETNALCMADVSWNDTIECTASEVRGLPPGTQSAIAFIVFLVLVAFIALILIFAIARVLVTPAIALYALALAFSIAGIVMCFYGSDGSTLTTVGIIGVVIACLGIVFGLVGNGVHCVQGQGQDYHRGSPR